MVIVRCSVMRNLYVASLLMLVSNQAAPGEGPSLARASRSTVSFKHIEMPNFVRAFSTGTNGSSSLKCTERTAAQHHMMRSRRKGLRRRETQLLRSVNAVPTSAAKGIAPHGLRDQMRSDARRRSSLFELNNNKYGAIFTPIGNTLVRPAGGQRC